MTAVRWRQVGLEHRPHLIKEVNDSFIAISVSLLLATVGGMTVGKVS